MENLLHGRCGGNPPRRAQFALAARRLLFRRADAGIGAQVLDYQSRTSLRLRVSHGHGSSRVLPGAGLWRLLAAGEPALAAVVAGSGQQMDTRAALEPGQGSVGGSAVR